MRARVSVRLKPAILDPQGKTVQQALLQLGYNDIKSVRFGKLIELELEGNDADTTRKMVEEVSHKLLSNPLMETFEVDLVSDGSK